MWAIRVFEWAADSSSFLQNRHTRCCYTAELSSWPSRENNASRFSLRRCHKTVAIQPWHRMKSNCRHSFMSFLLFSFSFMIFFFFFLLDQLRNSYLYHWIDRSEFQAGRQKFVFQKCVYYCWLAKQLEHCRKCALRGQNWDAERHEWTMWSRRCVHIADLKYNTT